MLQSKRRRQQQLRQMRRLMQINVSHLEFSKLFLIDSRLLRSRKWRLHTLHTLLPYRPPMQVM
jgi:hypothetical protein